MIFCGIDNGSSGSICFMDENKKVLFLKKTPSKKTEDYNSTKKRMVTRIKFNEMNDVLKFADFITLERPFKSPMMFDASISSARANEVTLVIIENNNIEYEIIDSKVWQHKYFPKKEKGIKQDLKKLSREIGKDMIKYKDKNDNEWKNDYDAFFIALYSVEKYLENKCNCKTKCKVCKCKEEKE